MYFRSITANRTDNSTRFEIRVFQLIQSGNCVDRLDSYSAIGCLEKPPKWILHVKGIDSYTYFLTTLLLNLLGDGSYRSRERAPGVSDGPVGTTGALAPGPEFEVGELVRGATDLRTPRGRSASRTASDRTRTRHWRACHSQHLLPHLPRDIPHLLIDRGILNQFSNRPFSPVNLLQNRGEEGCAGG